MILVLCHLQNPSPSTIAVHYISKLYLKLCPLIPILTTSTLIQTATFSPSLILLPFLPPSNPFSVSCKRDCLKVEIRSWHRLLQGFAHCRDTASTFTIASAFPDDALGTCPPYCPSITPNTLSPPGLYIYSSP